MGVKWLSLLAFFYFPASNSRNFLFSYVLFMMHSEIMTNSVLPLTRLVDLLFGCKHCLRAFFQLFISSHVIHGLMKIEVVALFFLSSFKQGITRLQSDAECMTIFRGHGPVALSIVTAVLSILTTDIMRLGQPCLTKIRSMLSSS